MSNLKSGGSSKKRNLPSWMCSGKDENDDGEKTQQSRNRDKSKKEQGGVIQIESNDETSFAPTSRSKGSSDFSKLMEGVVFVLSGFVNPERGILRSQMLEMGAEYQPDWSSGSTLLVCAFPQTPKFRQVEVDGGTIISKEWISECYSQRKLVDIEIYLLNAGKPWRRQHISYDGSQDIKPPMMKKSLKQEEKALRSKKSCIPFKGKGCFSPSKVKKWAVEDLKKTIEWLQNQDEKPDPGEISNIAAEGILTCLEDAIDALKQGQDIEPVTEQWSCIPLCVRELARLEDTIHNDASISKDDICREAMICKQIYELEFLNMEPVSRGKKKIGKVKEENLAGTCVGYDSDETIEMTEEEINEAYNSIALTL